MPKISFGLIALNALPFLEYNLQALYPFAHEIVVVEGATLAAKSLARPDGHSSDGTLEMLQDFQARHDPEGKLQIVTAQQDGYAQGFWPEKEEMSQAYAKQASGDWLWQVDSDEFYKEQDLQTIASFLDQEPELQGVSFPFVEFWGGFDYVTTGSWYLKEFVEVPRVFRWSMGSSYVGHRPPQVADATGHLLETTKFMRAQQLKQRGIMMYHYSYALPKQARQKVGYYSNVKWTDLFRRNEEWLSETFFSLERPMFLGERGRFTLQWLERFDGTHPRAIQTLLADIAVGKIREELRPTEDIERLLRSPFYRLQKLAARIFLDIFWPFRKIWKHIRKASKP